MFRWVTKGHGAGETIWPHGCQSRGLWETSGLPEADRQKGEDSLNKVEKKQQNRDLRAVCRWVKKNWLLIIITILFIVADTLSKIWMQTDNISIGAFMSSLTTVGLAYITAGFTVSQSNKKS